VVIAIIGILAAVLLPVLQAAKIRGMTAYCINNQKQLGLAWVMYANDNQDHCAGNDWPDEETWAKPACQYENWISGWAASDGDGGNGSSQGVGGPDDTNYDLMVNPKYATMGDYTKNPKVFLCPACIVLNGVNGAQNSPQPPFYPAIRTVSMNCFVGYNCVPAGVNPISGAGNGNFVPDYTTGDAATYWVYNQISQMKGTTAPVNLFIFMEERAESIDDGSFETEPAMAKFPNLPTDYHAGSATVAFGDGHVEAHKWHDSSLLTPQQQMPTRLAGAVSTGRGDPDWNWLCLHATMQR
jgi:prepilin-type processing-associated H-X9-DG protein